MHMKKFAAVLVMLAALASAAAAEVHNMKMLSIDLPSGWKSADPSGKAMRFSSPDDSAELVITIMPKNGGMHVSAEKMAFIISRRLGGAQPVERDGRWFVEGTDRNSGKKVTCLMRDLGFINGVETVRFSDPAGKHTDAIYTAINTIKYRGQ